MAINVELQQRLNAALQQMLVLYPEWRYGQLIANLAMWAKGPEQSAVWDVTDQELLDAAEMHLQSRKLESVPSRKTA